MKTAMMESHYATFEVILEPYLNDKLIEHVEKQIKKKFKPLGKKLAQMAIEEFLKYYKFNVTLTEKQGNMQVLMTTLPIKK